MRKIGAIAVLLVFLINAAGFYLYYIVQLQQIRKEMREALKLTPDSELEILTLTKKQFLESKVEEHEIRVNDKMYDIARTKLQGDMILVYCIHDQKEDNLLAFLNEIIGKPLKAKAPRQVFQFISLSYLVPSSDLNIDEDENKITVGIQYIFSLQTFSASPASPPPW